MTGYVKKNRLKAHWTLSITGILLSLLFVQENAMVSSLSSLTIVLKEHVGSLTRRAISHKRLHRRWPVPPPERPFSSSNRQPVVIKAFLERPSSNYQTYSQSATDQIKSGGTGIHSILSRTMVHRMRVAELRHELALRHMDTTGTKKELLPRLLETLTPRIGNRHQPKTKTKPLPTSLESESATTGDAEGGTVDPTRRYILQIKGLSSLSAMGTGVGIVMMDAEDRSLRWSGRKYLNGNRTVFEAEYSGLVVGVRYAMRRGAKKILVEVDHPIIEKQLNGEYRVRRDALKSMYWTLIGFKESLDEFSVECIPSGENAKASQLARQALATGKTQDIVDDADPMMTNIEERLLDEDKGPPVRKQNQNASKNPISGTPDYIDPTQTYKLQFDGGSRHNPSGVSGAGMVIYNQDDTEIWCGWKFLDSMSNNCAEYWAVLLGLTCAKSLGIRRIIVEGDSQLVIKQLKGEYRVKDEKLMKLWVPTKKVLEQFDEVELRHIFRQYNKRADWLANHAMDTSSSHGFDELDPQ